MDLFTGCKKMIYLMAIEKNSVYVLSSFPRGRRLLMLSCRSAPEAAQFQTDTFIIVAHGPWRADWADAVILYFVLF